MALETNSFAFGEYLLVKPEKVLLRNDKPVSITPKTYQLLLVLVENHGHIVEKDELMKAVWPDSFVEESNLTFTIRLLRVALGDRHREPHFIETVSRRGYRFIAEVTEISAGSNGHQVSWPKAERTAPLPARKRYIGLMFLAMLVLFGGLGLSRYFQTGSNAPILAAPFGAERFSSSGKVSHAALSPDGELVAFTEEIGGKQSVWLRKLATSENLQIVEPDDENYLGIVFAHDGQTVYFVRTLAGQHPRTGVYRLSLVGGIPEKILEFTEGWISLSPDDKQISFVRCSYADDDFCSLMIADTNGKNERKLVTRPAPVRISDNQFSPDGRTIAFASGNSENGASDFRLLKYDLAGGTETEITTNRFFEIKSLKWLADGNDLLLAALDTLDGKAGIRRVSVSTGQTETLTNDAANYFEISLNRDASRLIAIQFRNDYRLYFSSGGATKILTAAREAVFAPNGKIIYSADDNDIWTINRDGSGQRQLTNNAFKDFAPRPSSDGRFIYFASNRTGANQVWRMNADGSDQIQITKNGGGYPVYVSRDGGWIYFESGFCRTLWKVAADGSRETEISERKLFRPAVSPDENLVAFFFRDQEKNNQVKIAVMTISDKKIIKTFEFADSQSLPVEIAWSSDSRTLNYVTYKTSGNNLWAQSLDQSRPIAITALGDKDIEHFSLASDGVSFVYTSGEWLHDAILIEGLK